MTLALNEDVTRGLSAAATRRAPQAHAAGVRTTATVPNPLAEEGITPDDAMSWMVTAAATTLATAALS